MQWYSCTICNYNCDSSESVIHNCDHKNQFCDYFTRTLTILGNRITNNYF